MALMQEIKICIIDDDKTVCDSIKFLLEVYYDINIVTYYDPLLFLEECSSDWRGVLLIDLFMPSLTGINLMNKLKIKKCHMHVVIISGHASSNTATRALESGAFAFISKPFEVEHLLEKINTVLSAIQRDN
jgi:two-component system phosphoglycerate transport system response regulator PgtA